PNRRLLAGLSALVLVIAAVGGWLIWRNTSGSSPKPTASGSPTPAQQTGWQLGPASPFPVQQLHAAVLDNRIWLAGGLTGTSAVTDKATDKTEYYDTTLHQWTNGPPLPFPVHHAMMVAYQGKLWLIGGFLPSGPNLEAAVSNRVLFLDPAKHPWVAGPSLPPPRAAGAAVAAGHAH